MSDRATAAATTAAAAARLLDRPLRVADVGCRWGFADAWQRLGDAVEITGFDPDAEECVRLRERYSSQANVEIVALALSARVEHRSVQLTSEPVCSSFFAPDRVVLEQIADLAIMRPVGAVEVQTSTLDQWRADTGRGLVDFIKADVQGAEAEVLRGANRTLSDVVVMELEVEFNPLYEGQALFSEVDSVARSHGFQLWRLSNLAHYTRGVPRPHVATPDVQFCDSHPAHLGALGGQLFWGHALYVAADVVEGRSEDWQRPLRAGCLAAALELPDLALHAWSVAAALAVEPERAGIAAALDGYAASVLPNDRPLDSR
ncbi:MAG TPA: FkbM family methyltransferase [Solirubrobacteraceae bacterium]|nr:FkbM family methyltransferase [Solirubrobacteraceae bacterium]